VTLLDLLLVPVQAVVALYALHRLGVGAAGFCRVPAPPPGGRRTRFAVLVPAHDEEAVVGHLVRSLAAQDYPRDLYDVYVVADNCSDRTAEVAREAGAVVFERRDPGCRGKGHALNWLAARVSETGKEYDAACVLDADNLADPGFLGWVDACLSRGDVAVQGRILSKNRDDSAVSRLDDLVQRGACAQQAARERLGLAVLLAGTGLALKWSLLGEIGWDASSLVEDQAMTVDLLLRGHRVRYCPQAVVYDEKPASLSSSVAQKERWVRGRAALARRAVPQLLGRFFRCRDLRALELAMLLLQPARAVLLALLLGFAGLSALLPRMWLLGPLIWAALLAGQLLLPAVSVLAGGGGVRGFAAGLLLPAYSLLPTLSAWLSALSGRRALWRRTPHVRGVGLKELGLGGEVTGARPGGGV